MIVDGLKKYFETPFKDEYGCEIFLCYYNSSFYFESKNYELDFVDRNLFAWAFENIDEIKGVLDANKT